MMGTPRKTSVYPAENTRNGNSTGLRVLRQVASTSAHTRMNGTQMRKILTSIHR